MTPNESVFVVRPRFTSGSEEPYPLGTTPGEENVMALWLFKQEPSCYSFSDLERDGATIWDGVANALARKNLRQVKPGDRVLFYHTGKEKAIVGEMKIVTGPKTDPKSDDPQSVVVEVSPVRRLANPVLLATIKADKLLANWDLVRLPRLSVLAVTREQWGRVEELAKHDLK